MEKNVCPGNGLFVVEGEVSLLMTAMRRGVRWSSHSHQVYLLNNIQFFFPFSIYCFVKKQRLGKNILTRLSYLI